MLHGPADGYAMGDTKSDVIKQTLFEFAGLHRTNTGSGPTARVRPKAKTSHPPPGWLGTLQTVWARCFVALLCTYLAMGTALRAVLHFCFHDSPGQVGLLAQAMGSGFVLDSLVCVGILLGPMLFLKVVGWDIPRSRLILVPFLTVIVGFLTFYHVAEFYFFEEFNTRFNYLVLDYLFFPHEVFINIWESYNIPACLAGATLVAASLAIPLSRFIASSSAISQTPAPRRPTVWNLTALAALTIAELGSWPGSISRHRITAQIGSNGLVELVRAFRTTDVDFTAYYRILPEFGARERAASVLGMNVSPGRFPTGPLERLIQGNKQITQRPLDVVIILVESLGAQFSGLLGRAEPTLTPHLDRWGRRGFFMENLYATGNRTVRGLEGVLCSRVPLPGGAIVQRQEAVGMRTLASVFASHDYATEFYYGGRGVFDNLRSFMLGNGYQRFIEQSDFPDDLFGTIWGVADEFVFDRLLERQKAARARNESLFATLLTVSNHKPFDVPPGRTNRPPGERSREGAVAYSDYAVGRYLDQAQDAGLLEHTLVLVVGDHGARVYGSEQIPIDSYHVYGTILSPDPKHKDIQYGSICSQIDLAPTILTMCGIEDIVPFMGQSLVGREGVPLPGPARNRAFFHHNRDIGLLEDGILVVLGMSRSVQAYQFVHGPSNSLIRLEPDFEPERITRIADDAAAIFQTAYLEYSRREFEISQRPALQIGHARLNVGDADPKPGAPVSSGRVFGGPTFRIPEPVDPGSGVPELVDQSRHSF